MPPVTRWVGLVGGVYCGRGLGLRRVVLLCVASCVLVVTVFAGSAAGRETSSFSHSTKAATPECSRAAAHELVERLHLGNADDPQVSEPVGQVLCGPFMGPGSQAMVLSLTIPSCGRTAGWVVFGMAEGAWQLVMTRNNGADLAAVGSDIQETMFVLRPGDAHCFPTGGTRARIWHWDGTQFVASAWKQVTKGKTEPRQPSRFDSPSHNIHCWMFDGSGNYSRGVGCNSDTPRKMVNMNVDGQLKIGGIPPGWCGCKEPNFPPLGYGKQVTVGRLRCQSLFTGVRCTVVRSGKGFLISRSGIRRVGP
jgi:hypothetical protein